jgi:ABC-type sugar transport system substrate-binding protein
MRPRRTQLALCALAATLVVTGCSAGGSQKGESDTAGTTASTATHTAAEVASATGTFKVKPLFAVPKTLPKKYRLAFLNPGLSYPFFATWSEGMKAAAKYYGVDLDEADLNFKYDTQLDQYKQLAVKMPDVVGSQPMNDATYNQARQDEVRLVLIDGSFKDVPRFGVDDAQVGALAVDTMTAAAKAKMSGAWEGRKVLVAGLTSPSCGPCDARVKAAFAKAESALGIPAANTTMLTPQGQDPTTSAGSTFNDFLTAHPDDAVLIVSYGDEPVIGAINAAKAANRDGDILAVSNGGDTAARLALRDPSNSGVMVGAVDFQPYAEGWNWVEAAIATAMGQPFEEFAVGRVLTAANVDQFYPEDKTK